MKAVAVLCALVVVVSAHPHDTYTDRYDNTDVDEILRNERLLKHYVECIVKDGKCTTEAKELKSHIADALQTRCSKCTDKQKEVVRHVIKFLINEKPEIWKQLCEKYDPTGKYSAEYEKDLKSLKSDSVPL